MQRFYTLIIAMIAFAASAQIVTTSPSPLQESSASVTITYHADLGNQELMGLGANDAVYAHTGVLTNLSGSDWAYAPSWLNNDQKYKMRYVAPNTWVLSIGNIRQYYGITNPNETVQKLAFVFRNATGSRVGKTATGGDIFVDVLPDGLQLEFSSDAPFVLTEASPSVKFTAKTTAKAEITISVDGANIATSNGTTAIAKYTFAQGAQSTVIATAMASGQTISDTISICYPAASVEAPYPGGTPKMGAVAQPGGDVTFCLAAPGKSTAMIVGLWSGYKPTTQGVMNYTDLDGIRYFWTTVSGLDPDAEYPYYYYVDNTYSVGDPYARLVLDPYNDRWLGDGSYPGLIKYPEQVEGKVMLAVHKTNRDAYNWQVKDFKGPDQSDLIIYEMLVRDFTGTEGKADGNGTILKAIDKLDYLKKLGVNAIELMPIMEFNGNNSWGYNTNFYFAPDKAYGRPDDYRLFIDECHKAGMAVILDIVFNQSDGLHPWYQLYPSGSNPFYNASAPHAYSVLNDWNQDNLLVQQQWTDALEYWLTAYKADGFRFDLVKGLGDNESYGGNATEANTNKYNSSRVARMKRLTEVIKAANPNAYSINENLAGSQEENAMAKNGQLNWANVNEASCQFAMGFQQNSDCNRFYAPKDSRDWGSTVSYAESHDEQRMAYKQNQWGVAGVKGNLVASLQRLSSVAAQMILAPGAHMIWQFGEFGDATSTKNSDGSNNTDPKPVNWNWLDNPDRKGLCDNYSELIGLRRRNPELFDQAASFEINCGQSNWVAGRTLYASTSTKELICVINPNTSAKTISGVKFKQKDNGAYTLASVSLGTSPTFDAAAGIVTLPAGCYAVICNAAVDGIDQPALPVGASVRGEAGRIVVEGEYTQADVYTLSGIRCPSLEVPAGIYIVVVDGHASKVAVR